MHGYYKDIDELEAKLKKYENEQFRLKTLQNMVFQGKFTHWHIPDRRKQHILIYFEWLCEMLSLGSKPSRLVKWRKLEIKDHERYFGLDWFRYYVKDERDEESKKAPRKETLKIKGALLTSYGEECWFFHPEDPEYLIEVDGEYCQRPTTYRK